MFNGARLRQVRELQVSELGCFTLRERRKIHCVKAIIDSDPLINLIHLGLTLKLSSFFDVIYVPWQCATGS